MCMVYAFSFPCIWTWLWVCQSTHVEEAREQSMLILAFHITGDKFSLVVFLLRIPGLSGLTACGSLLSILLISVFECWDYRHLLLLLGFDLGLQRVLFKILNGYCILLNICKLNDMSIWFFFSLLIQRIIFILNFKTFLHIWNKFLLIKYLVPVYYEDSFWILY